MKLPLKKVPLTPELLSFWVKRVVWDDRYLAPVHGFEQSGHLLQVDACRADVVLQPEVVSLPAFRQ